MSSSPSGIVHVVDDDEHVRESTIVLLKAAGIARRAYVSGDAFLLEFNAAAGGCILLDLHMPGLSGFQVLDSLRESGNRLPVVLFSGRADTITLALAKEFGAAALLPKPVAPAELIAVVQRMLAESGASQAVPGGSAEDSANP